jgi:hypothetical protein
MLPSVALAGTGMDNAIAQEQITNVVATFERLIILNLLLD